MRLAIVIAIALVAPVLAAPPRQTPAGPLRAYKGPEGQIIAVLPVGDGTHVLVYFRKVDRQLDGKSLLYDLETTDEDNKDVFVVKKRGSKTYRSHLLTERDGRWSFFHPTKADISFPIRYSESASDQIKVDEVLDAYNP